MPRHLPERNYSMQENSKRTCKLCDFIRRNKRLSVIIASSALVLCAGVVFLILAGTGNLPWMSHSEGPEHNPLTGGERSVTYYYSLAGDDVNLTLQSGWYFTLEGPELNKSGRYTLNGDSLILNFVRESDEPATATVGENKLTLLLNGATCTFRKKINFTVTFESNGGTPVDALTVLNGKTATAPQAPTKSGFDFAGWYSDSLLTSPYGFTGAVVTQNITLYAKWTPKVSSDGQ